MKRSGVIATSLLAGLLASAPASAHGGLFRQGGGAPGSAPPPPGNPNAPPGSLGAAAAREVLPPVPGSTPLLAFSEERWEFWWEFNHDAYVNLRPSLRNATPPSGAGGFVAFEPGDEAQLLLPPLVRLLRDDDEIVRSAAVYGLARLQDESTLPYLSNAAVGDPSLTVRTHAVLALGLARVPKAVDRLRATYHDERIPDEVRAMAAVALGASGAPEGTAVLRDALAGGAESRLPHTLKHASLFALGLTRDPGNAPFLRAWLQAKGRDAFARALAIEALGRIGDRAANPTLIAALADDAVAVRRSAALVIGGVAHPDDADVVRALERTLADDADGVTRNFATLSLGRIAALGSPEIVDRLRARLKGATARERPFVALAIGLSGYQTALADLLAQFHQDAAASPRGALAVAIALLDQKEAGADLLAALRKEPDPALRGYLAWALGRLGVHEAAPLLRTQLADSNDTQVLYWTALGLGLLGDRGCIAWLEELHGRDPELLTRASYLLALGAIGDRGTVEWLAAQAQRRDEVAYARAFATVALGMLSDDARAPLPASLARDHNYTMGLAFLPDLYYLF